MAIKILIDWHHQQLGESLAILFEDRLKFEMYRPIGLSWWEEKFWNVYDAKATAIQYLGMHLADETSTGGWESWQNKNNVEVRPGIYEVPAGQFAPRRYKAITLEAAKATRWDFILSSTPTHFPLYENFRRKYQPHNPPSIFQSGNPWPRPEGARNILNSTTMPMPPDVNEVKYHQESNTTTEFIPDPTCRRDTVANLMHYADLSRFFAIEKAMPDYRFLAYGAGNRDGSLPEHIFDQTLRHEFGFVFHQKPEDGYGWNIHNAAACGKVLIANCQRLAHQKGGPLLLPGDTAIDLDTLTDEQVASEIRRMRDIYPAVSARIRSNFESVSNFDAEFPEIVKFLERAK